MNIKLTISLIVVLVSAPINICAQKVCGKVLDEAGKPILAASIYSESNPSIGTTTDKSGFFALDNLIIPETLIFSDLYHEVVKIRIDRIPKDTITVVLKKYQQTLMAASVYAQTPISKSSAVSILEPMDIYFEPQAQGDPLKAISIMPGATNTDEAAMPAFRGSSADRSLVVINGTPVHNPVKSKYLNNQGLFSLFNPEIIGKEYVHSSNPPLSYGNACSGLVDIQTSTYLEREQLQISAGLSSIGILGSMKLKDGQSFIQGYYNYQFSDAMVGMQKKSFPNINRFDYHDGGLNIYGKTKYGIELKSFTYFIKEHFDGLGHSLSYTGPILLNSFRIFSANYLKKTFKSSTLTANFGIDHDAPIIDYGNINNKSTSNSVTASINFKVFSKDKLSSQTGISFEKDGYTLCGTLPKFYYSLDKDAPVEKQDFIVKNTILEAYSYLNYYITSDFLVSAGLRGRIRTDKNDDFYLSWQASLKYLFSPRHYLLLGGGFYNSFTNPYYNVPAYYHMRTKQIALDYHLEFGGDGEIHAATYYKNESGFQNHDPLVSLAGILSCVAGAEISLKKRFGEHLQLYVSDAYVHQIINVNGNKYIGPTSMDYLIKGTVSYHTSNNFNISLSYTGHPGQRYHSISSSAYDENAKAYRPIIADLYKKRYPNYNRIDASISKYIAIGTRAITVYASMNNIFNANNPDYVYYNSDFSKEIFDQLQRRNIYFGAVFYFTK